jgi:hypothetical protein
MTSHWIDYGLERYRKVEDKMPKNKIITYKTENPLILEEVNEFLNKKGEYGFRKGDDNSDVLCFSYKNDIFAMTYTDGRIQLGPNADNSIRNYIENQLKIKRNIIKIEENKQKTFYVEREEAEKITDYLRTQGSLNEGTFKLEEGGEVKIQPHEGKIEIMCNCRERMIKELEGLIE